MALLRGLIAAACALARLAAMTRELSLRVAEKVCPSAFNLGVESAPVSFRHQKSEPIS
jgi:hypothetical protein